MRDGRERKKLGIGRKGKGKEGEGRERHEGVGSDGKRKGGTGREGKGKGGFDFGYLSRGPRVPACVTDIFMTFPPFPAE